MSEEDRAKKLLLTKIVVIFFTVLILSIWVFNLKNVWINDQRETSISKNEDSWLKLKTDFNKTLNDIQSKVDQINKNKANQQSASTTDFLLKLEENFSAPLVGSANNTTSTSAIISTSTPTSTPNLISSSTPIIIETGTANSLFNNKEGNCPKYINCMPTVGGPARSCQIPSGCENVTTLVY